jgi:hypothetical protein
LKAAAIVNLLPANSTTTDSLTPVFVVSGGQLSYSSAQPQYRFVLKDGAGAMIDSGLVYGNQWTPPAPLTPTTAYEWNARPEYRGGVGAWSASSFFMTPVAPGGDYGQWESICATVLPDRLSVVFCVWNFVKPTNSFGDLEVVKRVAWLLRNQGAGLLLKSSGENTVPWLGLTFSASRVCFPDGHIYKIIGDAGPGGTNSPGWSDNDFVDPSLYKAAINPNLR